MSNRIRTTHIAVGLLVFLVFLATGGYMWTFFPGLYESNHAIRYQFRANHIYILFSALVNIVLGLYVDRRDAGWRGKLQTVGSVLIVTMPALFIAAFFVEPPRGIPSRPMTSIAVDATAFGVLLHMIAVVKR